MTSHMLGECRLQPQYNTRHRYVILLLHEGGPEDLSYPAVARFMASELSSRRAVDTLPRWMWLPMVYGVVLPWRTSRARKMYEASWLPEGSGRAPPPSTTRTRPPGTTWYSELLNASLNIPAFFGLLRRPYPLQRQQQDGKRNVGASVSVYHSRELADRLQNVITEVHATMCERKGRMLLPGELSIQVEVGFTHQRGSIDKALDRARLLGNYAGVRDAKTRMACVEEEHLLVLPLYPQYSSLRTAAAFDALMRSSFMRHKRTIPHMEFIRSYATHPAYIKAMEMHIRQYIGSHGTPDWLFVIFDGLPKRFVLSGDAYQVECQRTYDALKDLLAKPYTAPQDGEQGAVEGQFSANGSFCASANASVNLSQSTSHNTGHRSTPESCGGSASHPLRRGALPVSPNPLFTHAFQPSRLTVSFLSGPLVGVEAALEPRTTRVLNSIAKQVRVIESSALRDSAARRSTSAGSRDSSTATTVDDDASSLRRAMMGSIYFICPGIVVDDVRAQSVLRNKLVSHSLACGWEKAAVIPPLNGSELHAAMLASILTEYIH